MAQDLARQLADALDPAARSHGYELVAVEMAGSAGRPTVRVYLDRPGGIDLDAIAEANGWISPAVDDLVTGTYTLEVSSPGIERPLVRIADFERFAGSDAHVKTRRPLDGRSNFTGRLTGVDGADILIDVEGTTYRIPHSDVAKARLRAEMDIG